MPPRLGDELAPVGAKRLVLTHAASEQRLKTGFRSLPR